MTTLVFLRENARWVAGGFLLMFFSSFGQTFFIALSAGDIRAEYGLSHGGFGMLYMAGTLASAATLPALGRIVDRFSVRRVVLITAPMLALACVAMAVSRSVAVLALTIYALRLFGQGMMSHISMTAMGRWFSAQRGRAVSLAVIGLNAGEAAFPVLFVAAAALAGWRGAWLMAAAILILLALPAIAALMAVERTPRASDPVERGAPARHWTRAEVLRDPLFYVLLAGVMAPAFIGTTIFFHQVYLVELRGWSLAAFAASFTLMSATTVAFALIAGVLIDRYSAIRLLPVFLFPLGLACLVLALIAGQWGAFAFMALLGVSYGISSALFGALWPEVYGTAHLGSVRALVVAVMVFATALGPGVTGALIDLGVDYPAQILVMGLICLAACGVLWPISRQLLTRAAAPA